MNLKIEINLLGELRIMKELKIKPNFSALQRKYNKDRHTIKKYYINGGVIKKERKKRESKYSKYDTEIQEILKNHEVNITSIYQYLIGKYNNINFSYAGLKAYIQRNGYNDKGEKAQPHLRFETAPGDQLQVDWKEDIEMISKNGEIFQFNIFTATLGFSRLHTFVYSKTRTTEDFIRCTIETLHALGGAPKHIITDNMPAVVSITNGQKKKNQKIKQFEKDINCPIKLCKTYSPETKGKVESANRFLNWLIPYNNNFENESEWLEIIKKVNLAVNNKNNQTTNIPPIKLYIKEKEYLNPLTSKTLLESYITNVDTQIVPPTLLVNHKGKGYSVPKSFISKRVKLVPTSNELYIYYNTKLITVHKLTNQKFNYNNEHYIEGLYSSIRNSDIDINKAALENLNRLKKIGENNE